MEDFKDWFENQKFVEFVHQELKKPIKKVWSSKKQQTLQTWKQLRPDLPIIMQPLSPNDNSLEKSSYGEDGIRITGSWQFIAGVISKLKNLISYENKNTRLRLIFRGVDSQKLKNKNKQSFVFYIHLQPRSKRI